MYVSAGTKFYGLVKKVGEVSIVTRFFMLQELPVFPLESRYLIGKEFTEAKGIPFLAVTSKTIATSIPLTRLDWLSVIFGYIRAVCFAIILFVVGGAAICGTIYLSVLAGTVTPGPPIEGGWLIVQIATICFTVAAVVGQATYMVPAIKQRDFRIRQYCGELLGICIDPALVVPEVARHFEESLERSSRHNSGQNTLDARYADIHQLILLRCQISQKSSSADVESATDHLLERLTPAVV